MDTKRAGLKSKILGLQKMMFFPSVGVAFSYMEKSSSSWVVLTESVCANNGV
jgi:hypothetical protein